MGISFTELMVYAKTQGEHIFTVSEAGDSGRVMKLSGANRTYSHTAEPRFVEKANKTNELPDVSAADAGKVLGVTEDGKIGLIEGGGGGMKIYKDFPHIEYTSAQYTITGVKIADITGNDDPKIVEFFKEVKKFFDENGVAFLDSLYDSTYQVTEESFVIVDHIMTDDSYTTFNFYGKYSTMGINDYYQFMTINMANFGETGYILVFAQKIEDFG